MDDLISRLIEECETADLSHPHLERIHEILLEAKSLSASNEATAQALLAEVARLNAFALNEAQVVLSFRHDLMAAA